MPNPPRSQGGALSALFLIIVAIFLFPIEQAYVFARIWALVVHPTFGLPLIGTGTALALTYLVDLVLLPLSLGVNNKPDKPGLAFGGAALTMFLSPLMILAMVHVALMF